MCVYTYVLSVCACMCTHITCKCQRRFQTSFSFALKIIFLREGLSLCVCVFVCSCVHGGVCASVWKPEVSAGCLSQLSLPYFLETGFLMDLEAHWFSQADWLASSRDLPSSTCPALGSQPMLPCSAFSMSVGDLSSGPHACSGSILPTEPFCL